MRNIRRTFIIDTFSSITVVLMVVLTLTLFPTITTPAAVKVSCRSDPTLCDSNAICTNTTDGYECKCNNGYVGIGNSCRDIDECRFSDNNCHKNARCTNTDGNYTCDCFEGYHGDGISCKISCSSSQFKCQESDICIPLKWTCDRFIDCFNGEDESQCCHAGFACTNGRCIGNDKLCNGLDDCGDESDELNCNDCGEDRFSCSNSSNDCIPSDWKCDRFVDCANMEDESMCCGDDFTCSNGRCVDINKRCDRVDHCGDGTDEQNCDDINECGSRPCQNSGTCMDSVDGFTCNCSSGYEGLLCETDINECGSGPCQNSGTCIDSVGGFTCNCLRGYEGVLCETDIYNCINNTRCNNNGTCIEKIDGFKCQCAPGWTGEICSQKDHDILDTRICGTRHAPESRIVSGFTSGPGTWPWAAYIMNQNGRATCGATLINKEWAITAAHCITSDNNGNTVVFGNITVSRYSSSQFRQQSGYTAFCHEGYINPSKTNFNNDICLLKLHTPVEYSIHVRPACLSVGDDELSFYQSGSCYLIGWGKLEHEGSSPKDLQEISTDIISYSDCVTRNNSHVSDVYRRWLSNNMLCTLSPGRKGSVCNGDGGTSLICKNGNTWHLVGIISWKWGCGATERPDVHTRVSRYLDWIQKTVSSHGNRQ